MHPALFKTLREALGLTTSEIAQMAGVNIRTAQRWEATNPPPEDVVAPLVEQWDNWARKINTIIDLLDEQAENHGDPEVVSLTRYRHSEQATLAGLDMPAQQHAALLGHILMALTREGYKSEIIWRAEEPPA